MVAFELHVKVEYLPVFDKNLLQVALVIANLIEKAKVEKLDHQLHVAKHFLLVRLKLKGPKVLDLRSHFSLEVTQSTT